jgi:hypothetical protein
MSEHLRRRHNGETRNVSDIMVETRLGRRLKHPELVHHVDGNVKNNDPSNLVVCPDQRYHKLIHQRTDAMNACGNPNWLKCEYCKKYGPASEVITVGRYNHRHRECHNAVRRAQRKALAENKDSRVRNVV